MSYVVICPQCQKRLKLKEPMENKKFKCSACGNVFVGTAQPADSVPAAPKPPRPDAPPASAEVPPPAMPIAAPAMDVAASDSAPDAEPVDASTSDAPVDLSAPDAPAPAPRPPVPVEQPPAPPTPVEQPLAPPAAKPPPPPPVAQPVPEVKIPAEMKAPAGGFDFSTMADERAASPAAAVPAPPPPKPAKPSAKPGDPKAAKPGDPKSAAKPAKPGDKSAAKPAQAKPGKPGDKSAAKAGSTKKPLSDDVPAEAADIMAGVAAKPVSRVRAVPTVKPTKLPVIIVAAMGVLLIPLIILFWYHATHSDITVTNPDGTVTIHKGKTKAEIKLIQEEAANPPKNRQKDDGPRGGKPGGSGGGAGENVNLLELETAVESGGSIAQLQPGGVTVPAKYEQDMKVDVKVVKPKEPGAPYILVGTITNDTVDDFEQLGVIVELSEKVGDNRNVKSASFAFVPKGKTVPIYVDLGRPQDNFEPSVRLEVTETDPTLTTVWEIRDPSQAAWAEDIRYESAGKSGDHWQMKVSGSVKNSTMQNLTNVRVFIDVYEYNGTAPVARLGGGEITSSDSPDLKSLAIGKEGKVSMTFDCDRAGEKGLRLFIRGAGDKPEVKRDEDD